MGDERLLTLIHALVDEEHRLESHAKDGEPDEARLARIGEVLDRCWELLNERRAKREWQLHNRGEWHESL